MVLAQAFVLLRLKHISQMQLQSGVHRKGLKCYQNALLWQGTAQRQSTAFIFNLLCFRQGIADQLF